MSHQTNLHDQDKYGGQQRYDFFTMLSSDFLYEMTNGELARPLYELRVANRQGKFLDIVQICEFFVRFNILLNNIFLSVILILQLFKKCISSSMAVKRLIVQ